MDSRIKTLLDHGEYLFEQKRVLDSFHQEVAENFYPERADFTTRQPLGTDFAAGLDSSIPVLTRRELAGSFSSMLRQREAQWFHIRAESPQGETLASRRWLEWAEGVMRRAMYDRRSQFARATSEGDNDFSAFGQAAISVERSRDGSRLLYRTWHLRDLAWSENAEGEVCTVHRKWKPTRRQLMNVFGKNVSQKVKDNVGKKPHETVEVRHIVLPSEEYEPAAGKKRPREDYVSIFVEVDTGHILEEVPSRRKIYVIPRWQTVSGWQYAFSPAVVVALPDARLLQAMTGVLLMAGEKASNPPMVATQNAVKSPIDMLPGGVTWADSDYDERLGEVLRPISQDTRGINYGLKLRDDTVFALQSAFYLDRLTLPPNVGAEKMTAFEVSQRVQEYIRRAIPLFEPMETEYNGGLCEETFDLMLHAGAFGPVDAMPPELLGADIQFHFESPLHDLLEQAKGQVFLQSAGLAETAAKFDPSAIEIMDVKAAFREALAGIGAPATWARSDEEAQQIAASKQAEALAAAQVEAAARGASAVKDASVAAKNFADVA